MRECLSVISHSLSRGLSLHTSQVLVTAQGTMVRCDVALAHVGSEISPVYRDRLTATQLAPSTFPAGVCISKYA